MSELETHIDSVITEAVQAKIDAAVLKALSGDEVMGRYITAALNQELTIRNPHTYRDVKTTFLKQTVNRAVQVAVEKAVNEWLAEEHSSITDEVRKALRRNAGAVAEQLVGSLTKKAESPYALKVDLQFHGEM